MALSTEQVIETVSKITGLPHGLFKEQVPPRTRGGLTNFVFDCDAESDEYSILVNAKDEIIEIKNAYNTWGQAMISIALNPPPPLAQRPDPSNNTMTTGAFQSVPYVAPPPVNIPQQNANYSIFNYGPVIQFLVDFIKLNPGCISNSVGSQVNEACTHNITAWTVTSFDSNDNIITTFYLDPTNCGDQVISDNVGVSVTYDASTGLFTEVDI